MISKKVFKNLAQVPQIYQCLVCHQIPTNAYQDSDCGRLICKSCRLIERVTICDCKNITQIDNITHKTLQQIQISCHLCLSNIDYLQFNKHIKRCQFFQIQRAEIKNLQLIKNDNLVEKRVCKICQLQCNSICKYCLNQSCNICSSLQRSCCQQIKFNQLNEIQEEDILKIQDDSFECNLCSEKINNLINHSQQCQVLQISCEFCKQDYQRKSYVTHLKLCLSKRLVSLNLEMQIQDQIIDLQRICIKQGSRNFFRNEFYEIIYDRIAREDDTISIN